MYKKCVKIMGKENQDLYNFAVSYENIIKTQGSNIVREFLGLESIFEMRKKFKNYSKDLNDYAAKTVSDKQELRKKFANVIVDRKRFDEVLKLQTEKNTIKKMREN